MKTKHIPSYNKHAQGQGTTTTTNDHQLSLVTQDESLLTKCFIGKSIIGGPSWLGLMKKAFRSPIKENVIKSIRRREEAHDQEEEEKKRGKRRWIFRKPTVHETTLIHHNQDQENAATTSKGNLATNFLPKNADLKQKGAIGVAMTRGGSSLSAATTSTIATDVAIAKTQATIDITQLTQPPILVKQQCAILVIQTTFRGYLARKALGALKGVVKLQALIRGHNVRKRAQITLQCMQSLVRVQTQVCDQRRRLSCEGINCGSMFKEPKSILELHINDKESNSINQASIPDNDGYDHLHALEKIEALLHKAKVAAKKRENTLAHAFSRKMWTSNKDEDSSSNTELDEDLRVFDLIDEKNRKNTSRASCDQPRDRIKNIEIDTACSYSDSDTEFRRLHHQYYHDHQQKLYSSYVVPSPLSHRANINALPMTPPLKMKNIQVHSASPRYRREENNHHRMALLSHRVNVNSSPTAVDQPSYMAATASARARERSQSTPRQIPMTPERDKTSATKKRLSFPIQ
ncbi:protein IQ-DOMAIN 18-like isoform X1 [Solanum stenotomum]|uniref:protein IQ-DOMAIN 18-like isoform X1 n=1 Tax=Solanum stenotomum TaxID=172797 RepID=UPI0020D0D544|nr:protein IQ-DOMAIN 18-like isoform X1 [Solanum stenotomum]